MFDAYTVKKVLPRLVAAVVLIQLSWFLFTGMIQLTTAVAYGIEGLMLAPFGGATAVSLNNIFGAVGDLGSGAGVAGLALVGVAGTIAAGGIFALGVMVFLALFVGFMTLVLRKALLIALLLLSPIALVAWILPGTERFWKIWWDNFSKLLLMFPLILIMLAAGRIFAFIFAAGVGTGFGILDVSVILISVFVPFALIPMTYKAAGAGLGAISGAIGKYPADWTNRARDRGHKRQAAKMSEGMQRTLGGKAFKNGTETNLRGAVNRRLQRAAHLNKAGLRPGMWGSNINAAVGATNKQLVAENLEKNADYATWKGNDDLNRAAAETNNANELRQRLLASGNYNRPGGEQQMQNDIARVERVRKQMGNNAFRQMTWQQAVAGGTAYNNTDAWRAAGQISGGDDAVLADMVAGGRSAMMSAGRVDQGGAGFGDTFNLARDMRDNPAMTDELANETHFRNVIEAQGPSVIAHSSMKNQAIENLVPAFRQRLQQASASGNEELYDRELAQFASVYDSIAADSPGKARILADGVMRWDASTDINAPAAPPGSGPLQGPGVHTIQQDIDERRGSEVFQSTRRELNAVQERAGAVGGGAGGGPGGPATGAPTGLPHL